MIALVAPLPGAMADPSGSVTADGATGECAATGAGDLNTQWHFTCYSGSNVANNDGTGVAYAKTLRVVSNGCVTAVLSANGVEIDNRTMC